MSERIPVEEMERARDDLAGKCGLLIINLLCNDPGDIHDMAKRCHRKVEYIRRKLLNPRTLTIRDMSDFCAAFGHVVEITARDRRTARVYGASGPVETSRRAYRLPPWFIAINDNSQKPMTSLIAIDRAIWGVQRAA